LNEAGGQPPSRWPRRRGMDRDVHPRWGDTPPVTVTQPVTHQATATRQVAWPGASPTQGVHRITETTKEMIRDRSGVPDSSVAKPGHRGWGPRAAVTQSPTLPPAKEDLRVADVSVSGGCSPGSCGSGMKGSSSGWTSRSAPLRFVFRAAQGGYSGEAFRNVGGDLAEREQQAARGVEHGGGADHDAVAEQVEGDPSGPAAFAPWRGGPGRSRWPARSG
jgi:hypothetical protein